jgi:arsenate reductase
LQLGGKQRPGLPNLPGVTIKLSWPFPDPSGFEGSEAARLEQTRQVRDAIKAKIESWCAEVCSLETRAG